MARSRIAAGPFLLLELIAQTPAASRTVRWRSSVKLNNIDLGGGKLDRLESLFTTNVTSPTDP